MTSIRQLFLTVGGGCPEAGIRLLTGQKSEESRRETPVSLPLKLCKAMVFPVVRYGCESWTVKKLSAEELMLLNCGVGEDS